MNVFIPFIVAAFALAAEIMLCPMFLRSQKNGRTVKSLLFKMLTSSCFLAVAACAYFYRGETSVCCFYMLIAVICAWFGDLFLHLNSKVGFVIGFLFFLGGHVLYIAAFHSKMREFLPDAGLFSTAEIFATVASIVFLFILAFRADYTKGQHPLKIAAFAIYAAMILFMAFKALRTSVFLVAEDPTNGVIPALLLVCGAYLFVCSDVSLGLILVDEEKKKDYPLKIFNIVTYYAAVSMLALTVFVL